LLTQSVAAGLNFIAVFTGRKVPSALITAYADDRVVDNRVVVKFTEFIIKEGTKRPEEFTGDETAATGNMNGAVIFDRQGGLLNIIPQISPASYAPLLAPPLMARE